MHPRKTPNASKVFHSNICRVVEGVRLDLRLGLR